jgi:hypothetical protein
LAVGTVILILLFFFVAALLLPNPMPKISFIVGLVMGLGGFTCGPASNQEMEG